MNRSDFFRLVVAAPLAAVGIKMMPKESNRDYVYRKWLAHKWQYVEDTQGMGSCIVSLMYGNGQRDFVAICNNRDEAFAEARRWIDLHCG